MNDVAGIINKTIEDMKQDPDEYNRYFNSGNSEEVFIQIPVYKTEDCVYHFTAVCKILIDPLLDSTYHIDETDVFVHLFPYEWTEDIYQCLPFIKLHFRQIPDIRIPCKNLNEAFMYMYSDVHMSNDDLHFKVLSDLNTYLNYDSAHPNAIP